MSDDAQKQLDELVNSPEITNIDIGDADLASIAIEKDIKKENRRSLISIIKPIVGIAATVIVSITVAFTLLNYSFVIENVSGAILHLGPISVVTKDYDPQHYLYTGATIWYDGNSASESLICVPSSYKMGKITKVNDAVVMISGAIKDQQIPISNIDFVVKEE